MRGWPGGSSMMSDQVVNGHTLYVFAELYAATFICKDCRDEISMRRRDGRMLMRGDTQEMAENWNHHCGFDPDGPQ